MTDYRVGIYIRLSLADGDGKAESDSIGNQRELIHQFLDRHPQLKNAPRTEFVDDGYTGTNTDRPQFQALMKELRTGAINVMVTKDFSRCHRDYTQMGNYLECVFPFLGVRYISINDGYDSDDYKNTRISPSMTEMAAMVTRACPPAWMWSCGTSSMRRTARTCPSRPPRRRSS